MTSEFKSSFAENIFRHKYALTQAQTWREKARSIVEDVCGPVPGLDPLLSKDERQQLTEWLTEFKWIPGGRYIYYAGRKARFWSNCFSLAGQEDTREEWGALANRAFSCLMVGGGIGVDYSVFRPAGRVLSRTGGVSSGPVPLIKTLNEIGRNVCQGGSRRSAIFASLNWQHDDIDQFLVSKDWHNMPIGKDGYTVWDAKADDFNFNAPLDMTNISAGYDNAWLSEIEKGALPEIFVKNIRQALQTGEPGMSFNFGAQEKHTLRNAPVCAGTMIMTDVGYKAVSELVGSPTTVWTGKQWARDVVFKKTGDNVPVVKVIMTNGRYIRCDPSHPFLLADEAVSRVAAKALVVGERLLIALSTSSDYTEVISVIPDGTADVYCADVGVEEHCFQAEGVLISNCCEFISDTDSDSCNLSSVNLGAIDTLDELKEVVNLVSKFLICGSIRGHLPYQTAVDVRAENRRIGLGLMGMHEWLLKRNYPYEVVPELHDWLAVYRDESERSANEHCDRFYLARPKAYRAIAPTGTIAILAGTTSGIEPLFATAYKRRYLVESSHWRYEYVVDSVAELMVKQYGVDPDAIETAASMVADPERRIKFQYDTQAYVDMAISSTLNLPAWGSDGNNEDTVIPFAKTLAKYAHGLRGFTCYPDGSRGGQPITTIPYQEAMKNQGVIFEENSSCRDGVCGV